ncbi:acylamino-acid-releasing enzyme-like [Copidosoma floridanum]|uniref:acylamino-acid-releasing enzyme-like n=1 Tax=Copidosoma floridanum TaxID=29053 RepID=UPI0006C9C9DD|nr:acylamino-acid-releasing enzyme-like [Copidosoma floridanum]
MADKAKKPEPKKEGKKEEPPKEEPKKEEPKSEEPKKEEPKKDEEPKELMPKEEDLPPRELTLTDKILELYEHMSQNPSLVSARIISIARNGITVQSVWSQRNLQRKMKQKFTQDFSLDAEMQPLLESFPVDVTTELLTASSENERLKAILREVVADGKKKHFIEIWDRQHLTKSYDLSVYDFHGEIYTDNVFSSFQFSPDNKKLMYIAEKKLRKVEPFYKQKPKYRYAVQESEEDPPLRGGEYEYKPDWGEQLEGKHRSVIVLLNLETDSFFPLPFVPDEYFPAEVIWTPNGQCIVGVAYKLYKRYLGRYGCSNRESYIFILKGTEFRLLTGPGQACKTPQFSPNGKHLIWLERDIGKPHHNVQRLMRIKWDVVETPDIVVDVVKTSMTIANDKVFYGFYGQSIPKRCWSNDSEHLFLSTPQRSSIKSYVVNLETKVVTEIDNPDGSSLSILDVRRNRVVFTRFSNIQPPQLVVGKFDPASENIGNLHLYNCTKPLDVPKAESLMYEHTDFIYKTDEPVSFAVLQVNYRGSTGMGSDNIEFLSGRIGETDVVDCTTAIDLALKKYPHLDPKKVCLYGSCHGAYLCAHLSGQYPAMFRAVVMRAPIIDIQTMFNQTDIPDW